MTVDLAVLLGCFAAVALVFVYTLVTGSPPTPTSPRVRRAMMHLLPRHLPIRSDGKTGKVYELGAGWGGNVIALAKTYPEAEIVGIERSPLPWLFSRLRLIGQRRENASFELGDFTAQPLSDASLVVCYLSGPQMAVLADKLADELTPGTLVMTHTFAIPDWRPVDTVQADDMYRSPIYLYEVPTGSGAVADASHSTV